MEFRLIYEGQLPSNGNVQVKHEIRKHFHVQLAELWEKHRALQLATERYSLGSGGSGTLLNKIARKFELEGYHFVKLINVKPFGLVCELDILFMRRGVPGKLVMPGGDIDNRIKTVLDALRVPHDKNEVVGTPDAHEQPYFFCLLEDDALVTRININTDRLLKPLKTEINHPENEVLLIIHVTANAAESLTIGNVTFTELGEW